MIAEIYKACSFPSAANRHIADNFATPVSPTRKKVRASLKSAKNTAPALRPIAEQAAPAKPASLLKILINLFQCRKPTVPQGLDFFGYTISFDVVAIRKSHPGDESHFKANELIDKNAPIE